MNGERNKSAEFHADRADDLLRKVGGEVGMDRPGPALDARIQLAQAHALTALALRKVGGR